MGKIAGPGTRIEELEIDGEPAIWIDGAPHFFFYRSPGGEAADRDLIAANVLLVQRGDLLVRLEGGFGRARAIEIARSL